MTGVQRSFDSFSDAVAQIADARVFAGIHFRFACDVAIPDLSALGFAPVAWDNAAEPADADVPYRIERWARLTPPPGT